MHRPSRASRASRPAREAPTPAASAGAAAVAAPGRFSCFITLNALVLVNMGCGDLEPQNIEKSS